MSSNEFVVYKVRYKLAVQDPDTSGKRYHTVVFVATEKDGSGWIHHVTGDLVKGMYYERKKGQDPERSATYYDRAVIGKVSIDDYPSRFEGILQTLPPPPQQKAFNIKTNKTEPIKPDGSFYEPGEERQPLIKCTEWTEQQAIPALRNAILR